MVYSLGIAAGYSLFELIGKPCGILPWCSLNWLGLDLYQYGFMLPLFTFFAIAPIWSQFKSSHPAKLYALGTFLIIVLMEDWLYFVLGRTEITPGIYTTQWGYLAILPTLIIPVWYLFFIIGAICCFFFSLKLLGIENARIPGVEKRTAQFSVQSNSAIEQDRDRGSSSTVVEQRQKPR
ncbi:MAG TPA: hypothetical protein VFF30_10795 [Nitrososphaerales archaeon]|nr:hypothetical protein [Nitrososphaerales archaeon]